MNNMLIPATENREKLPQLIKKSSTYKLFVPAKVEEKIRYLIRKFPHTEWSGVLFYTHTGNFEQDNLEIHCEDIFPMDLGSSGWTEFKMTPEVTAYIADNLDLFNCEMGLVHSHHTMGAFFSGQDTRTLQVEGNDTNCFVSLIVDTRGTYQAAITRKLQIKRETIITDLGSSYEFFGEGSKSLGNSAEKTSSIVNDIIIEYFMLDVTREETNNPFDYLDARFEEIEAAKTKRVPPTIPSTTSTWLPKQKPIEKSRVFSLDEWEPKIPNEEPTLFDKETMQELEVAPSGWHPNKELIHNAIVKMLICCLNINPKGINLRQWITQHMEKVYKNLFESDWNEGPFESWSEFIVEFLVEHYDEDSIPWDYLELEEFFNKVAEAMIAELEEYRALNPYIDKYIDILSRYLIVE